MIRSLIIYGCALAGVALAEESTWSRVLRLASDEGAPTIRNSTFEYPARPVYNAPLVEYAEYPEYFAVDYCARYQCSCFKPFSTNLRLSWLNSKSGWCTGTKNDEEKNSDCTNVRAGCVANPNDLKEVACMWHREVCDCNKQAFFEETEDGLYGMNMLYPQGNDNSTTNRTATEYRAARASGRNLTASNGTRLAIMKAMKANRVSSTQATCLYCQTGFELMGGQCYQGGTSNTAITMAVIIGLLTVPSIIGIWYVLHSIVDPSDTGMEVAEIKKGI